jgi:hypothetical protein
LPGRRVVTARPCASTSSGACCRRRRGARSGTASMGGSTLVACASSYEVASSASVWTRSSSCCACRTAAAQPAPRPKRSPSPAWTRPGASSPTSPGWSRPWRPWSPDATTASAGRLSHHRRALEAVFHRLMGRPPREPRAWPRSSRRWPKLATRPRPSVAGSRRERRRSSDRARCAREVPAIPGGTPRLTGSSAPRRRLR